MPITVFMKWILQPMTHSELPLERCVCCENRHSLKGGAFDVKCPVCRRALLMAEPCKVVRSQMLSSIERWGPVENWQETNCGCERTCSRLEAMRQGAEQRLKEAQQMEMKRWANYGGERARTMRRN